MLALISSVAFKVLNRYESTNFLLIDFYHSSQVWLITAIFCHWWEEGPSTKSGGSRVTRSARNS
jgi:hypothetical protein